MDGALLIEAHGLGAAREHLAVLGLVIVCLSLLCLLRPCRRREPGRDRGENDHTPKSMRHTRASKVTC